MKQNQTHNQTKPHAVPTFCAELTRLVQRSLPLSLTHFKTHFLCLATEINECSIPEWLIKLHPPSLVTPSIIRTERSISVLVVILIHIQIILELDVEQATSVECQRCSVSVSPESVIF